MDEHILRHMFGTSALWLLMVVCLASILVDADRTDLQKAIAKVNNVRPESCIPGPHDRLDNVTFNHGQWNRYANIATKTANLLTKLIIQGKGKLSSVDEYFLYAIARNNLRGEELVYGGGIALEPDVFPNHILFAAYAHKSGDDVIAFDLSQSYNYLQPYVEFYAPLRARDWENQTVTKDNVTYGPDDMVVHSQPQASLEDGHWTYPYFDCGAGNIWMVTYSAPIFGFNPSNNRTIFRGIAAIDIDLTHIDINQCDMDTSVGDRVDMFRGTHMCQETTKCRPIKGLGFQSGAYTCECEDRFYFPNPPAKAFNGADIERALNASGDATAYRCLPCSAGCNTCKDATPCQDKPSSSAVSSLLLSASLSPILIMCMVCFHWYP